jgi:hypothetical protein
MEHEASVSKISEDQLFYLMSRGMTEDEAAATIVRGFVEPIARELPMEYALELNRLIELRMEGRSAKDDPPGSARARHPRPGRTSALLQPRGLPGTHRARGRVALPKCHVTAETDPAPQVAASRAERGSFVRRERRDPPRSGQSAQLRCDLTRACYDSGPAEA